MIMIMSATSHPTPPHSSKRSETDRPRRVRVSKGVPFVVYGSVREFMFLLQGIGVNVERVILTMEGCASLSLSIGSRTTAFYGAV